MNSDQAVNLNLNKPKSKKAPWRDIILFLGDAAIIVIASKLVAVLVDLWLSS